LKRYEGMFLFDTSVVRDWAGLEDEVRRLLGRIGAELLVCVKFDERKLAFEIKRRKRGTYVLTYFDAQPEKLVDLERDVQLSETVLRAMFLRAEGLTEERLAALRAHPAEQPLAPLAGDGRRHDDDRPRGDRGDRGERGYRGDRGRERGPAPEEEAPAEPVDAAADQGESEQSV
jgi:small subunit ribosomal protein S6